MTRARHPKDIEQVCPGLEQGTSGVHAPIAEVIEVTTTHSPDPPEAENDGINVEEPVEETGEDIGDDEMREEPAVTLGYD